MLLCLIIYKSSRASYFLKIDLRENKVSVFTYQKNDSFEYKMGGEFYSITEREGIMMLISICFEFARIFH